MNLSIHNKKSSSSKIVSAGLWYTASSILLKGISVISLPIFTRLLSTEDYGVYSNIVSWQSIFSIITTFNLSSSLIRARHDYENDFDGYCSSILIFGSVITALFIGIVATDLLWFSELFGIPYKYLIMMVIYLFFSPSIATYLSVKQLTYQYRAYTYLSILIAMSEVTASLALVMLLDDKLAGRIIGLYAPQIIISIIIYILIVSKEKKVKIEYCKYAFRFCLPLVPHLVSTFILAQSDRIMIFNICGPESTALYSLAYSLSQMITILWSSLNSAFSPWLGDMIRAKNYEVTRKSTKPYVTIFLVPVILAMLVAPEILLFFGGEKYMSAVPYIPPVFLGCAFQFFYSLYVNIEQYEKKNWGVAIGTMCAAAINIILNFIFIPVFGPIAAAYTTLVGYGCLLLFHILMVKRIGLLKVYDGKAVIIGIAAVTGGTFLCQILYNFTLLRYIIVITYAIIIILVMYVRRNEIKKLIINH